MSFNKKVKIKAENGKVIANRDGLAEAFKDLDGLYIISFTKLSKPKTIDEWRKHYFFLRDILFEDGETGYTKNELHDMTKNALLQPHCTTTVLDEEGWETFIKSYKEWAFESFNCYL